MYFQRKPQETLVQLFNRYKGLIDSYVLSSEPLTDSIQDYFCYKLIKLSKIPDLHLTIMVHHMNLRKPDISSDKTAVPTTPTTPAVATPSVAETTKETPALHKRGLITFRDLCQEFEDFDSASSIKSINSAYPTSSQPFPTSPGYSTYYGRNSSPSSSVTYPQPHLSSNRHQYQNRNSTPSASPVIHKYRSPRPFP